LITTINYLKKSFKQQVKIINQQCPI